MYKQIFDIVIHLWYKGVKRKEVLWAKNKATSKFMMHLRTLRSCTSVIWSYLGLPM